MLLDPRVNANALTWAADANKARTSTNVSFGRGLSLVRGVELGGFEPPTFSLRTRRATNCAIAPCLNSEDDASTGLRRASIRPPWSLLPYCAVVKLVDVGAA